MHSRNNRYALGAFTDTSDELLTLCVHIYITTKQWAKLIEERRAQQEIAKRKEVEEQQRLFMEESLNEKRLVCERFTLNSPYIKLPSFMNTYSKCISRLTRTQKMKQRGIN